MTFTFSSLLSDTYGMFSTFPSSASGTVHSNLAWRKLKMVENVMGESIPSGAIPDKYYQPMVDFTVASILGFQLINDSTSVGTVSIGDFSYGDADADLEKAKNYFELQAKEGLDALKFLNYEVRMYKAT